MKLHFIGVGGTGMGALASLMKAAGHDVRGSDLALYPPMSTQLERAQVPVFEGYTADNLAWGPDRIVVGNVCSADHPEVVGARELGLPLESFPQLLEHTLLERQRSLVVAGTHGKTTTSALLSWLLAAGGKDPSWLVGGVPQNLGRGAHLGEGEAMVVEGDEYDTAFFDKKSKFLHYRPQRAILTCVEFDHADIFDSMDEVRAAFGEFVELLPEEGELVVHLDDSEAMGLAARAKSNLTTYRVLPENDGDVGGADFTARVTSRPGARRTSFELYVRGESRGELSTMLVGRYNVANALAAMAVAHSEGVSFEAMADALRRFRGVKRRQELLGVAQGVRVLADFAHHPTAVQLTISAIRRRYPDSSLHVCFEPRSSSSRRSVFFDAYTSAFDVATRTLIGPVHAPERVPDGQVLDTAALAAAIRGRGGNARSFDSVDALADVVLAEAVPGDTVLLLSSGAFGGLGPKILDGFGDAVTFSDAEDRESIDRLLTENGMPALLDSAEVESLVIRGPDGVQGCVHLQLGGDEAFFFGLAVAPSRRGEGLGWVLADCAMRRARTLGARAVVLLPGAAADFFADKLGFVSLDVDAVEPKLRAGANFDAWRVGRGDPMRLALPGEGEG